MDSQKNLRTLAGTIKKEKFSGCRARECTRCGLLEAIWPLYKKNLPEIEADTEKAKNTDQEEQAS